MDSNGLDPNRDEEFPIPNRGRTLVLYGKSLSPIKADRLKIPSNTVPPNNLAGWTGSGYTVIFLHYGEAVRIVFSHKDKELRIGDVAMICGQLAMAGIEYAAMITPLSNKQVMIVGRNWSKD